MPTDWSIVFLALRLSSSPFGFATPSAGARELVIREVGLPWRRICSRMQPKRMLCFNSFLSKVKPVTFEESLCFVKKVKARDHRLYLSLFDILSQKEQKSQEIYHDLLHLFENHDDLRSELMRFKPHDLDRRNDHQNPSCILFFFLPMFAFSLFLMFEHSPSDTLFKKLLDPNMVGLPWRRICSRMQPKRMLCFNSFLSKVKPVTFEESLCFVKKVKARDHRLYLSLFDILSQKEQKSQEIYHDLLHLFENHDDLRSELMRFKPHDLDRRNDHQNPSCILFFFLPMFAFSLFLMFEHSPSDTLFKKLLDPNMVINSP